MENDAVRLHDMMQFASVMVHCWSVCHRPVRRCRRIPPQRLTFGLQRQLYSRLISERV